MYKIIRFRRHGNNRVIQRNLSLTEAQKHCNDESTHKIAKNGDIVWFDGYSEQ